MPKGIYKRKPMSGETKKKIGLANSKKVTIICKICNKEFFTYPARKNKAKYCSYKCMGLSNRGKPSWNKGLKGRHFSPKTEFKKGDFSGNKHPQWKGGISPLRDSIRSLLEYKLWRKAVFEQDNYTCQKCFKIGGKLNIHHHKKSFSIMLKEFLQVYSQFSPIDDKETLIRLALTYAPFWDLNNGKTLCRECHKKTDNYLKTQYKLIPVEKQLVIPI